VANDPEQDGSDASETGGQHNSGVYRPPKLAPVPYSETKRDKSHRVNAPSALAALKYIDSSAPYVEKSTGLGVSSSLASSRARELERMTQFEEENMTRLVMNKKEATRRRRDEEDIALGGTGGGSSRGRGRSGLDDEFRDILHSTGRARKLDGDGYEELRQRSKRKTMFDRSAVRQTPLDEAETPRKKGRFEMAMKKSHKRLRAR